MSVESFRGPGGAQLFYRYDDFTDPWQDSPTAVLAHGFSKTSRFWYSWVPSLARHFRVVRSDLRGLGLSKVSADSSTPFIDSLVLDAIALFDHLKVKKVVWIGEATGALVGLHLATRVPERLHTLVMMSAPLKVSETPYFQYTQAGRPSQALSAYDSISFMLTRGMRAWASAAAPNLPWTNECAPGYLEWYIDQMAHEDPRLCAEFRRNMLQVDAVPLVKDIGVPTLYVDGDRDSHLTPEWRQMLEQHPRVRMVRVEGPGIDICYARPEACIAQVKAFLQELGTWRV